MIIGEDLVDTEGDICKLQVYQYIKIHGDDVLLTSKELSAGLPLPLPMPHAQRKNAQVIATPIRTASMLSISGKVVILHRK